MVDVWFGLVERDGPKQYFFQPYIEIVAMAKQAGLKVQVTGSTSFRAY